MSGLNITLNDDQMRAMLSEAMLRALDAGTREAMISRALEYLVKPQEGGVYGRNKTSPLEDAFRSAVERVARDEAQRLLTADEKFQAEVKRLLADAMQKLFTDNREVTITKIADAITKGLASDHNY